MLTEWSKWARKAARQNVSNFWPIIEAMTNNIDWFFSMNWEQNRTSQFAFISLKYTERYPRLLWRKKWHRLLVTSRKNKARGLESNVARSMYEEVVLEYPSLLQWVGFNRDVKATILVQSIKRATEEVEF